MITFKEFLLIEDVFAKNGELLAAVNTGNAARRAAPAQTPRSPQIFDRLGIRRASPAGRMCTTRSRTSRVTSLAAAPIC
jgi:hypothetical protein